MATAVGNSFLLADRGDGRLDMEGVPTPPGEEFNAYPVIPGGFLHPHINDITNQAAKILVTNKVSLDGVFTIQDGGAWNYTAGTQTGVASFDWEVPDYDAPGSGNSFTGSVARTVA